MLRLCHLAILLCFLSGCGYRFGKGELCHRYSTICIPYAEGDEYGVFTAALIREMTARGCLSYKAGNADLTLKVCLFAPDDSNIGFIYAPERHNTGISKVITANEARLRVKALVTLVDRRSGTCLLGPLEVCTSLAYDFEPDLGNINENSFSLGQLEMHNIAQDAALPPVYTLLAEKIVDYVNNTW